MMKSKIVTATLLFSTALIISDILIDNLSATTAAPVAAPVATPAPTVPTTTVPIPPVDPNSEQYLTNVVSSVAGFNHRQTLVIFNIASKIPSIPSQLPVTDQAVLCLTLVANNQIYRVHSTNPNASGIVQNPAETATFGTLFSLAPATQFLLNAQTPGNACTLNTFKGVVISRDGDGTAQGDSVCFARYLLSQSNTCGTTAGTAPLVGAPGTLPGAPIATPLAATPIATAPVAPPAIAAALATTPMATAAPVVAAAPATTMTASTTSTS